MGSILQTQSIRTLLSQKSRVLTCLQLPINHRGIIYKEIKLLRAMICMEQSKVHIRYSRIIIIVIKNVANRRVDWS